MFVHTLVVMNIENMMDKCLITIHYYWLCSAVRQPIESHYCPLPSKKKYLVENTAEVLMEASERLTPENRTSESSNSHDVMSNVDVSTTSPQMESSSNLLFDRIFGTKKRSSDEAKRKKMTGIHGYKCICMNKSFFSIYKFKIPIRSMLPPKQAHRKELSWRCHCLSTEMISLIY